MLRYVVKRLALAVITMWLLATIVFLMVKLLSGDPARAIYGNTAPEETVVAFKKRNGLNDPLITQYGRLLKGLVTLDFGNSWKNQGTQVWDMLRPNIFRSAKLAVFAMVLTTPFAIGAGLLAAKRRDSLTDRGIVTAGLATSSVPEFVTGSLLVVVFGLKLKWFEPVATIPAGTSVVGQFKYLFLPAAAMAIVYFGYIARMMRAGALRALDSDYVRTARLKGVRESTVMRTHVIRNAIPPTITVMSVQIGYLLGGILGVELVFNYAGMSTVIKQAVDTKDLPVLQVAVLVVGGVYMIATLIADIIIAWLNPRARTF
jgi:peptide/nickel transport system permease protein